jgi:hypothetical protein
MRLRRHTIIYRTRIVACAVLDSTREYRTTDYTLQSSTQYTECACLLGVKSTFYIQHNRITSYGKMS